MNTTLIGRVHELLRTRVGSAMDIAEELNESSRSVRTALSELSAEGSIALHHLGEQIGEGPLRKYWIARGPRNSVNFRARNRKPSTKKRKHGSGVIAPPPYARGLVWLVKQRGNNG